jgi:transcription antitermination factor NusG
MQEGLTPPELYQNAFWYVCRTRARAEKQVARLLMDARVEAYLPLVARQRTWSDRIKRVEFPLFAGYVFARFNLRDVGQILRVPGVAGILHPNGYPTPVREDELESVRCLVRGANETGVEPVTIDLVEPGDLVFVSSGPFKGMKGVLVEERGRTRVAVQIWALRQASSVELGRDVIVPAHSARRGMAAG